MNCCNCNTATPVCDESENPINTYVSSAGSAQYHLGNYYNWAAALATNDSSVYDRKQYANDPIVEQSICPAGWTLPRIGTCYDSFYDLWDNYGFGRWGYDDINNSGIHDSNEDALWTSPLYFIPAGTFNSFLGYVGYGGSFWSPIPHLDDQAVNGTFDVNGSIYLSYANLRSDGYSVRCIARPVINYYYSWDEE